MATEVLRRRGTTAEHSTFTGGIAELTVDLDKDTVVVHDGSTVGGFPLLREDVSNNATLTTYVNNSLTASELQQLQNINAETISNTQWAYLGALDQGVSTTDNVTFNQGTFNGEFSANEDAFFAKSVFVDGGMFAEEFVVEQNRLLAEFRMGPAGGKIETVSDATQGAEKVVFTDQNGANVPVDVGSIILIQSSTGLNAGTIIKQIYRRVSAINPDADNPLEVQLTDSGITWTAGTDDIFSGPDAIVAGDQVVGIGHTTDATLDHFIHFDIAAVDIPAIRFWDGVNDVGAGTEFMRVGGLDGFQSFGSQDVGIGIGTAHYLSATANSGAGEVSFSGGVLSADGSAGTVDVTVFTADDRWLTDGNVYIGGRAGAYFLDELGFAGVNEKLFIGAFDSNNPSSIFARGPNTNTFVGMRGIGISDEWMIRANVLGNTVFEVSEDQSILAGLEFNDGALVTGTGSIGSGFTAGTVTGLQAGVGIKQFFSGADDELGTNASYYVQDGRVYYDAMGGTLSSKFLEASFGENTTAPSLIDDEWFVSETQTGTAQGSTARTVIRGRYQHRFGIDEVMLSGQEKFIITVNNGQFQIDSEIRLIVRSSQGGGIIASDTHTLFSGLRSADLSSAYSEFTLTLPNLSSSLTVGNYYIVEVELYSFIDGDAGNAGTDTATLETYLREDYTIEKGTGAG